MIDYICMKIIDHNKSIAKMIDHSKHLNGNQTLLKCKGHMTVELY